MKTKIKILPIYFYEEERELVNLFEKECINYQKLVKSLLWKWYKEQESK